MLPIIPVIESMVCECEKRNILRFATTIVRIKTIVPDFQKKFEYPSPEQFDPSNVWNLKRIEPYTADLEELHEVFDDKSLDSAQRDPFYELVGIEVSPFHSRPIKLLVC